MPFLWISIAEDAPSSSSIQILPPVKVPNVIAWFKWPARSRAPSNERCGAALGVGESEGAIEERVPASHLLTCFIIRFLECQLAELLICGGNGLAQSEIDI